MDRLAGTIRVDRGETGEKSFAMGPGAYAFLRRGVVHRAQIADGEEECRYVLVRTGEGESAVGVDGPGSAGPDA